MEMYQMRAIKSILLIGKSQEVLIYIVYCISKSKQIKKYQNIYSYKRKKWCWSNFLWAIKIIVRYEVNDSNTSMA